MSSSWRLEVFAPLPSMGCGIPSRQAHTTTSLQTFWAAEASIANAHSLLFFADNQWYWEPQRTRKGTRAAGLFSFPRERINLINYGHFNGLTCTNNCYNEFSAHRKSFGSLCRRWKMKIGDTCSHHSFGKVYKVVWNSRRLILFLQLSSSLVLPSFIILNITK